MSHHKRPRDTMMGREDGRIFPKRTDSGRPMNDPLKPKAWTLKEQAKNLANAAPELLKACKRLLLLLETLGADVSIGGPFTDAAEAIAKAEGQS